MRIVNKRKFIRAISILVVILSMLIFCSKYTYSNVEIKYKEEYIYSGDTLWEIANREIKYNEYFKNKDIRDVIDELKNINNLSNSNLIEGDKIKIPIYE